MFPPGVGAKQEFEHRVGMVQLEQWTCPATHPPCAALLNEPKTLEFRELCLYNNRIQTKPRGGLASGERRLGFQQAQTLHADGGKRRPPRNPRAHGEERKNRA